MVNRMSSNYMYMQIRWQLRDLMNYLEENAQPLRLIFFLKLAMQIIESIIKYLEENEL